MNLPDVPDFITRERYVSLIESVGLKVHGLRMLEFRLDGIYAEVIAKDTEGHAMGDDARPIEDFPNAFEPIAHRVFIPIR